MIEYRIPLANTLSAALIAVCFVIALVAISARGEGRARIVGVLGVVLLFASAVLRALNGSLGPWLTVTYGARVDAYGLGSIIVATVGAIGLVLVVLAVVMAHKAARSLSRR